MIVRFEAKERPVRLCGRVAFFSAFAVLLLACEKTGAHAPVASQRTSAGESLEARVRPFTPPLQAAETCFNAVDDNQNGLIDEGCGVNQGQVQFVLAWDEPLADLDLYVTDPNGQIAPADSATDLGLAKSLDCPDEKNVCAGQNYENVYLEEEEIPRGKYMVRVRVEKIPEGSPDLRARLSVRLPSGTKAHVIEFSREEQEVMLEFSVAPPKKKE